MGRQRRAALGLLTLAVMLNIMVGGAVGPSAGESGRGEVPERVPRRERAKPLYTIRSTDPPRLLTDAELGDADGDENGVIPLEEIMAAKDLHTAILPEFQSCIELYWMHWKSRAEVLPGAPQPNPTLLASTLSVHRWWHR